MSTPPYNIPDPDYPFLKKVNECSQYHYALKFWENPPIAFTDWLESKEIDPATVLPRTEPRGEIEKRIRRAGKQWQAKQWRTNAREEITKLKLKNLRRGVAYELVWWVVEEVIHDFDCDPENPDFEAEVTQAGMEFLPDFMRWVAEHPGLAYSKNEETEQIRFQTKQYEKSFPCPNQRARTMFITYRGDKTRLREFFREYVRRHFEEMKSGGKNKSSTAASEHKRIDRLEKDVLGVKKPGG